MKVLSCWFKKSVNAVEEANDWMIELMKQVLPSLARPPINGPGLISFSSPSSLLNSMYIEDTTNINKDTKMGIHILQRKQGYKEY